MKALPTKADLLQQDLVVIDDQHKSLTTNTLKVAEYFGKQHKNILQRINNLVKKGRLKIQPSYYLDEQGRKQKYSILDRKNFSIVVLGFTGEQAEIFRIEYVEQFEKNAAKLIEWEIYRQDVIEPTKTCNDSIKWLSSGLKKENPSSNSHWRVYQHIQQAITKAATGDARTKREEMTAEQLKLVQWMEDRVHDEIERMKALGASAVDIRQSILDTLKSNK